MWKKGGSGLSRSSPIPADLEQIVLRCVEKNPPDRYPDIESLEKALARCSIAGQWTDEDAARWWLETDGVMSDQADFQQSPATAVAP